MFKYYALLLISCSALYSATPCTISPDQRDLVIFNDPNFNELTSDNPAIIDDVLRFFLAQSSTLLVQTSLWQRFVQEMAEKGRFHHFAEQIKNVGIDLYDIEQTFVLIIPTAYKKRWNLTYSSLGFSLVTYPISEPYRYMPLSTYTEQLKSYVIKRKNLPFVLNQLFPQKNEKYSWNIVMFGHGINTCSKTLIAGVLSDVFQETLQVFNTKLRVNLFTYLTCFGGGKASIIDAYTKQGKPLVYNYPIILSGLIDSYATNYFSAIVDSLATGHRVFGASAKEQFEISINNIKYFFNELRKTGICEENYDQLVKTVEGIFNFSQWFKASTDIEEIYLSELNNLLQIRMPGVTYFKPLPLKNLISLISDIAKQEKKSISTPLKVQSKALIIDSPYMDTTINITNPATKIASNLPQQEWLYIKAISTTLELGKLLTMFSAIGSVSRAPAQPKFYLIDTYSYNKNAEESSLPPVYETLQKVIVVVNGPSFRDPKEIVSSEAFFVKNNQAYVYAQHPHIPYVQQAIKLSSKKAQPYLDLFDKEKTRLRQQARSLSSIIPLYPQAPNINIAESLRNLSSYLYSLDRFL